VKDSIGEKKQTEWRKIQLCFLRCIKFYFIAAILFYHVAAHGSILTV